MNLSARRLVARAGAFAGIALVCALACGCRSSVTPRPAPSTAGAENTDDDAYLQVKRLAEVMLNVQKNYVDPKTCKEMMDGALEGMLRSLDEHSHYLNADQFNEIQEEISGEFGGVGIMIDRKNDAIVVVAPIEDTPAFKAGVLARDVIIEINGTNTAGMAVGDAVKRLRGAPGTAVTIKVRRQPDQEPKVFDLTRANIEVPSVKGTAMLDGRIGYVRISQFSEPTAQLLRAALEKLEKQDVAALVLDLRSNPGGLLSSAIEVAGNFLKAGDVVVTVKGRGEGNMSSVSSPGRDTRAAKLPVAVLVDSRTASASEIVAGALQDQRRAFLVGERTFGKGSVQSVVRLNTDDKAGIRLTTARYLTPGGREIHKIGLEPDIVVPVPLAEWADIITRRAHLENPDSYSKEEKDKYADVTDPQLERALEMLRALLAMKERSGGRS